VVDREIGKLVGTVPVARAYAFATAAIDAATPNSPAPPGSLWLGGMMITLIPSEGALFGGQFHSRV
jgi:hypothetical protein